MGVPLEDAHRIRRRPLGRPLQAGKLGAQTQRMGWETPAQERFTRSPGRPSKETPSNNAPWLCALRPWRRHFPGFHSCNRAGRSITNSASRPGSKPAFTTAGCVLWASRLTSLGLLAHLQKHLRCTGL